MAFDESDRPMTNSVPGMTDQDFAAERAAISAEREELAKQRAALNGNGAPTDADRLLAIRDQMIASEMISPDELIIPPVPAVEDPGLLPWPHAVKTLEDGFHLEYRAPDSSAMIALSLVGMDGFDATQQSLIFNKFMSKHLSTSSLAYVLGRMMDPDDTFGLSELISTLTKDDDKG